MVRTKLTPRYQPDQRVVCARASPQLRRAQCSQPSGVRKRICAPSTSIITPRETMQAHAREELRRLQEEEAEAQLEKPGEQLSAVPVKAACGPGGDHTTHHIPAVQGLPVVKALPVVRAVAVPVAVLVAEPACRDRRGSGARCCCCSRGGTSELPGSAATRPGCFFPAD